MSNRLASETSPYLLQHKDNPVDWHPWGKEALELARKLDRPLIVSIGYSACHWCHVMEHECFENPQIAQLMNDYFVCVKVDREERPDVDAIYMEAVQSMTGQGGWPLNVFITPDQVPFYGGTYFPPEPRQGMASWPQILAGVEEAWRNRRDQIESGQAEIADRLRGAAALKPMQESVDGASLRSAIDRLYSQFDTVNGGFGSRPKFPCAPALEFLLHYSTHDDAAPAAMEMASVSLQKMARGGIYDQVGGGFARYSVDAQWQVPHFEKMLYDNALLARCYLHAFQLTDLPEFARVCSETLEWVLREMVGPEGAFYAALDADSEGVEGKFYVWDRAEIQAALEPELASEAIRYFGVTERGNFEGKNILLAVGEPPAKLAEIKQQLLTARAARVRPGLDDKRLTAWNAMMIGALAQAAVVLERDDFLAAAERCADFILQEMRTAEGKLLRTYSQGQAKIDAYLEDYALLIEALLDLYEANFDQQYFVAARELADYTLEHFYDNENGGFFSTSDDGEALLVRRKELDDSPLPSGNSSAAYGLLRLAALSGEARYEQAAASTIQLLHKVATAHPSAFGHLLQAIDFYLTPTQEIAIAGPNQEQLLQVVRSRLRPFSVQAASSGRNGSAVPLLRDRSPLDGAAAAYVCEGFVCQQPITDPEELAANLQ